MRCLVTGEALEKALRFLQATTTGKGRATLPILSHILFDAREDQILRLMATDLTMWLEFQLKGQVIKGGKTAVSSREFKALVSSLSAETLEIEAPLEVETAGKMIVRFGDQSEYRLSVLCPEEFPPPPFEEEPFGPFTIEGRRLKEAISKVLFSAATDPTMGIFTGVHFRKETEEEPLEVVATDTHRLSLVQLRDISFPRINLTLPSFPLKILLPLLGETDEVNVFLSRGGARFQGKEWTVFMTALAGSYADYRKVIPKEFLYRARVRVKDFLSVLRRFSAFKSQRRSLRVLLRLILERSIIELILVDTEGEGYEEIGKETIKVEWVEGGEEPIAIAFQHHFLMEFFSAVKASDVLLHFQEPLQAALFTPAGEEDFCYIVMPIHLPEAETEGEGKET